VSCPVCLSPLNWLFNAKVLGKYPVSYLHCKHCGFISAQEPFWLEEAYSSAIASTDTGLVRRNLVISAKLTALLFWVFNERGQGIYVDIAGGYGLLTRLMRDMGLQFYWTDKYCANLLAHGFEYPQASNTLQVSALTAIEVMEHTAQPLDFLTEQLQRFSCDTVIFTTELYQGSPPNPQTWWYYAFETGQHISFFHKRTLEVMAKRLNMHFYTAHGIHLLSAKKRNPVAWYMASSLAARIFSPLLRFRLGGGLTFSDHKLMVARLQKNTANHITV